MTKIDRLSKEAISSFELYSQTQFIDFMLKNIDCFIKFRSFYFRDPFMNGQKKVKI